MDFSVIIPTYNRAAFLRLAIVSALRQKSVSLEIIVSDENSTDNTKPVIRSFHDSRIRYTRNKTRLGTSMNMRKCILLAHGTYIFTLGDDDFILDDYTLRDIKIMMNKHNLGMGKIGAIGYKKSPIEPYQIFILSKKSFIRRPEDYPNILASTVPLGLGYFSGLVFNNSYLNKQLMKPDHACFPDHMCLSYHAAAYDLILRHGIGYIPGHFVVGHLSLELIPRYFNMTRHGRLFMEEPIIIAGRFLQGVLLTQFASIYLRSQVALLPNIKFYSGYRNYICVLKRMIELDKTLVHDFNFLCWAFLGGFPNRIISLFKIISIKINNISMRKELSAYNYYEKAKNYS